MLGELGVSKRLRLLLEGESLFNDGTAVVVFTAVAALAGATAHGTEHVDALWIARLFFWEVGVGFVIGLAIGVAHYWLTSRVDDHLIEITLTTIAAFGSYLVAHSLHASGVIAVVTAGLMAGNFGHRLGMSPSTRVSLITFWEYVTFVANSLVFLLIGLEIDLARLWDHALVIVIAFGATLLGRGVTLGIAIPLISKTREKLPKKWAPLIWWGGLHGALSMVLAMSLPADYVHRGLIIDLAFGTVLLSILGQGLTLGALVKLLKLVPSHKDRRRHGELIARLQIAAAARAEVREHRERHQMTATVADRLESELSDTIATHEKDLLQLRSSSSHLEDEELHAAREHLIDIKQDALAECFASGVIDEEAMQTLVGELDARLNKLEEGD